MTAVAALAAWCLLGAAEELRLDAGLVTAARTRTEAYERAPTVTIGELEAIPSIALSRRGRLALRLEYDPRLFLVVDVSGGAPELTRASAFRQSAQAIQRAQFLAEGRPDRPWTLRLGASGTYGRDDLRSPTWVGQPVPTADRVLYVDARATADVEVRTSRQSTLTFAGGVYHVGGADAAAQSVLPLQDGVAAEVALSRDLTRRDELAIAVAAKASRFSTGVDSALLRAAATWQHEATRAVTVRLGGGVAGSRSRAASADVLLKAAPWAEAALRRAAGPSRVEVDGGLRLEPMIDSLTGGVDERLVGSLALGWQPWKGWALGAVAYVAALRPLDEWATAGFDGPMTRTASLEARAGRRIGPETALALVGWGRAQQSSEPGVRSFVQWGGSLELALGTSGRGRLGSGDLGSTGARDRR